MRFQSGLQDLKEVGVHSLQTGSLLGHTDTNKVSEINLELLIIIEIHALGTNLTQYNDKSLKTVLISKDLIYKTATFLGSHTLKTCLHYRQNRIKSLYFGRKYDDTVASWLILELRYIFKLSLYKKKRKSFSWLWLQRYTVVHVTAFRAGLADSKDKNNPGKKMISFILNDNNQFTVCVQLKNYRLLCCFHLGWSDIPLSASSK